MKKEKLTYDQWKKFCDNCLNEKKADPKLFELCIDYFPFSDKEIKGKAIALFCALEAPYLMKNILLHDIERFLRRAWLLHVARPYKEAEEREKDQIMHDLLLQDAQERTYDMIALAGRHANDIFGECYLDYFYKRT